jgi:hypothetical protein
VAATAHAALVAAAALSVLAALFVPLAARAGTMAVPTRAFDVLLLPFASMSFLLARFMLH